MSDDDSHTFTGLLPEILKYHILPQLGPYDRWQLMQTAKRYARVIPMPWTKYNKKELYLASAPLDKVHTRIARDWFGHEYNRDASYQHANIEAFIRNPYHTRIDTILVPYAERYTGFYCSHVWDKRHNLEVIFTSLLRLESPARFLHEWCERFPDEWNMIFADNKFQYKQQVLLECLERGDVLDVFSRQKSPYPLHFTTLLWSWLPAYIAPPLDYFLFDSLVASKGFIALVVHDADFRAMVEKELIRTPMFPDKVVGAGSSMSSALPLLVGLCEQFKVPVPPTWLAHKLNGRPDVDWLAPLIRVLGAAWVRTHVDIGATFFYLWRDHLDPAYVQLVVDHKLLDMTRDTIWSLKQLGSRSLTQLRDIVTKILPVLAPHRDKIPGCERFERVVRWLHEAKEEEKTMWPDRE